jgi:hypothetical protein
VRISTSAVTGLPFTVIETVGMIAPPPQNCGPKAAFLCERVWLWRTRAKSHRFRPDVHWDGGQSEPRPGARSRELVAEKQLQFGRLPHRFRP